MNLLHPAVGLGRPLTAALGLELDRHVLSGDPTSVAIRLRELVDRHAVVLIRGAHLSADELVALADRFGSRTVHPVHRLLGRTDTVSIIQDDRRRPPAGFTWHRDLSWLAAPPRYGFLHALEIPRTGGDTLWASQAAVLAALPSSVARRLDDVELLHRIDDTLAASVARNHGSAVAVELCTRYEPIRRRVVETGPDGRRRTTVSPLYHRVLDERDLDVLVRAERLLDDPDVSIRWSWQVGDLAIWDEAATVHRALTDHYPQRRVMRRCTVDVTPSA